MIFQRRRDFFSYNIRHNMIIVYIYWTRGICLG